MKRASSVVLEPLTPTLSPSDGEREKTAPQGVMVAVSIPEMLKLS